MTRYIITRNGEHIGKDYPTREAAEQAITYKKRDDQQLAAAGWISQSGADATQYGIVERRLVN